MVTEAPEVGDIVWTNFTPQSGREQAGRRPALVLSPKAYNEKSGRMIVCPITSKSKGYPFEVAVPDDSPVKGVILSDHLKSVDWNSRGSSIAGRLSIEALSHVRAKIKALLAI